eukprot:SAG11_NODE_12080_length_722_cov_54.595506_2_plen_48_part_00
MYLENVPSVVHVDSNQVEQMRFRNRESVNTQSARVMGGYFGVYFVLI